MAGNSIQMLKSADPSTIHEKFLVGYQGWFTCPGDGEPVGPGHHGWLHWFNYPIPDGGRPNTDVWPDVSSYSPSELFPAPGLKTKSGEQTFLFSSRNAKTVQRHFHWMAEHGVDGAFLQRFAGQCDLESGNKGIMRIRDEVGERVREAAEREGRVFAIMYDVSGVPADRIQRILQRDWVHLVHDLGVLDSPNYLREKGKPVIALWGFGFHHSGHTPNLVREITKFFRNTTPGGVYIMGGTPAHWRTGESDADRNPEFLEVWLNEFDAISPWTVGRYRTEHDADNFAKTKMKGDWELITNRNQEGNTRKVDYIPVVLPGGSGYNLSEGKWGFNDIKREGGRFLWRQIYNARHLGVRTIYGAMWDEYDEGTAFMPIVEHKASLPESDKYPFLSLDEDGYDLPSDWYMRICGFAAEGLRNERRIHETFPVKELQDYWSSRPRYEDVNPNSKEFRSGSLLSKAGDGDVDPNDPGGGQTYQEWLALQREEKEEVPPPPYTLESGESQPATTSGAVPAVTSVQPVASSSHAAASPPVVNNNTYPTSAAREEVYSQVSAQSHQSHTPAQGHSPQPHLSAGGAAASPPVVNVSTYPTSAAPAPRQEAYPQVSAHSPPPHPPSQGHSPQPHLSGVHGQQSVSPSRGHSPQPYPQPGVSQSHQPYPSTSGHSYPYPPTHIQTSQPYPLPSGQNAPAGGPSYQSYPTSTGHSQVYPSAGTPSQGYPPSHNTHHIHNQSQDPVATLANEFGRQSISGPSDGRFPTPPPLHPAHPNYLTRPPSSNASNGPQSQSGPTPSTNRPRWPPVEWDSDTPPVPQFSGRSGNGRIGANLMRLQTVGASSHNPVGEPTLRPTVSMSSKPSRPNATSNMNMPSTHYSPPVAHSHSDNNSVFPYPAGPPMHVAFPDPQFSMPSGYPEQTTYNPGMWPGSGRVSPPIVFPGSPMAYNVPGSSYGSESHNDCGQFHHFPQGPDDAYFGGNNMGSSPPFATPDASRPPTHPHSGHHSSSNSKHSSGSGALGLALSAIDKVAGRKARDQVDNITQHKLFNKFK